MFIYMLKISMIPHYFLEILHFKCRVRYIFASLFCVSKRNKLANFIKFYHLIKFKSNFNILDIQIS